MILALALLAVLAPADDPAPPTRLLCLLEAYPDHLDRARLDSEQGWLLEWKDGSTMDWDDGKKEKTYEEKLESPDLQDMMSIPYPLGELNRGLAQDEDPGRIRYEPFFRKMYGDNAKAVRKKLVKLKWLPDSGGKRLKATSTNNVHKRLAAISDDLKTLPRKIRKLAATTSGPFSWRVIHGTKRLSVHSFAIALDVAVKQSDYWRWSKKKGGEIPYRNRIPYAIAKVFERHGFIWGGKWYHYDTMHFEYRPELLDPRCATPMPATTAPSPAPTQ
jgi:peptidoglycan LD-endopeptidase CwlK